MEEGTRRGKIVQMKRDGMTRFPPNFSPGLLNICFITSSAGGLGVWDKLTEISLKIFVPKVLGQVCLVHTVVMYY